jgi:hypothetical protein
MSLGVVVEDGIGGLRGGELTHDLGEEHGDE